MDISRLGIRVACSFLLIAVGMVMRPTQVTARGEILGIHILHPDEVEQAKQLLSRNDDKDQFITIPLSLNDLEKQKEWQRFFDKCHSLKLRPIVRLVTRFEGNAWKVPNRKDVLAYARFLSSLEWHRPELTIILFNEPNHMGEWGNSLQPEQFAQISAFAADWFHTEFKQYTVLPAGMDLAAPTGATTMEAFTFLQRALKENNYVEKMDGWTSHSYPNPGFSSSPKRTDKMGLRGYQHELAFLTSYTKKELPVYITETGWDQREVGGKALQAYYLEAFEKIWGKDNRIVAVTPFLLQGAPGNFAPFSFMDKDGKPTLSYQIYRQLLQMTN